MKLFSILTLSMISSMAAAQVCKVDMINRYNQVVQTYTAYGDPDSCMEGMKQCRKAIRLEPQLGGVDCVRAFAQRPVPQPQPQPIPRPQPQPVPQPQPIPRPIPQPQPIPQPIPQPRPQPSPYPEEVLRMNELDQAINYTLEDCYVVPKAAGWANQLYIRGQFAGNYEAGVQDIELRRTIRDYQSRGQCLLKEPRILQIQFRPGLLDQAVDRSLARNCYVLPQVSGWSNQLFVDEQFLGNYNSQNSNEQMKLKAVLADYLASGRCQARSYDEIRLLQDPYLLQNFADFQYRGCYVKLNVSGWANQLYVNNQFRGNFDSRSEVIKLKSTLVDLIIQRKCIYDPM